jgi:hypothetical protein
MTNSDKKETFTWFLIAISPITFGLLIVAAMSIIFAKNYDLNFKEDGIIILPIYFTYTFLWARIYRKVTGLSWLN